MRRLALTILVLSLLLAIMFQLNISHVKAAIHQGDLVITGNDVYVIENQRFDINGSIIVEENATLVLRNATLNFTQTHDFQHYMVFQEPANGNPRFQVENATIAASSFRLLVYFYDNSSATISNLATSSYIRLEPHDSSSVSISDSTLAELEISGSSVVWLLNSTCGIYYIFAEGEVYVNWYLDTHVIDSLGENVPLANVTAYYPNATASEMKMTDMDGWTRLTLLEKMMNATDEYPIGNYTVEATHETYSNSTTVNMTDNQMITLRLSDFIIPEFLTFLVLPLLMIVTLLTIAMYERKRQT